MRTFFVWGTAIVMTVAVARAHDLLTTRVTWNADIAPLLKARCASCHTAGGSAPMPLVTYEQARPWARAIKEAALERHMPNWRAARGYGDFLDDPSLSPFEIALIASWADGGTPRGTGIEKPAPEHEFRDAIGSLPRRVTLPCGEAPLPRGRLVGVRPGLQKDQSVGIAVRLPNGQREVVAWIRNYDPRYPTSYRLRTPLRLPRGSRLITEGASGCTIDAIIATR